MSRPDDVHLRCLVIAADSARSREVLEAAIRTGSAPDGESLEPEHVDPRREASVASDDTLNLLEWGAATVADLSEVPPGLFALLAWHARVRPASVVLLRPGSVALPFPVHEFAVHSYLVGGPEEAARSRTLIARLATLAASARNRDGVAEHGVSRGRPHRALRRRRERNGVADALRAADRAVLRGAAAAAVEAVSKAVAAEPLGPDLWLRLALLHREAGRWREAERALRRAVSLDDGWAPPWRELGIVRDRAGIAGAADALRRAVDLDADYPALVALSFLLSRRGESLDALRCLERAIEAAEGQPNLVLPALVLRAACTGHAEIFGRERRRVEEVLEIRRAQAESSPPEDAPWSSYDAATACLLLGDAEGAALLVRGARAHTSAPWEAEPFAAALDSLERAGVAVAPIRALLGASARRDPEAPAAGPRAGPTRPFRAEARDAAWFVRNVPCATACPVGTDAGAYVSLVARRRFAEGYLVARGPNPFASVCGSVCSAPCESACRRGRIDQPVAIRALKRFLTERHGPESGDSRLADVLDGRTAECMEGPAYASHLRKWGAGTVTGRRVAVVGGGPAGLACAHDLAFLGHRVTVFEVSGQLGGMMRHGIPDYRLPRDVLDAEIGAILGLGVEVRLNEGLDATRTLASLAAEGFSAVFLASGAGRGRSLDVEGAGLDGVVRAIDFLINVNNGFRMDLGQRVVVMGGGNVAIDVARTARLGRPPDVVGARQDAPEDALGPALPKGALRTALGGEAREVHVVARQPMGKWPAQRGVHGAEEVEAAQREGLVLHPLRGIRRILGGGGRVTAVELAEVVRLVDDRGRYAPVYGGHAAETIPCDAVLLAVGQEPDLDYLAGTSDLRRTPEGFLETDPATLATSVPHVYAGGDAAFGPRTLIEAVAEGKRAAASIHSELAGGRRLGSLHTFTEVHPREVVLAEGGDSLPREEPPVVALKRRTGVAQVDGVYDEETAVEQASRCLTCHVQTIYDGSLCVACGRCTDACPYGCLSLVPATDVDASGLAAAAVAAGGPPVAGSVWMLKDEDLCVRCGLCAERCPTGAMTMERYDLRAAAGVG